MRRNIKLLTPQDLIDQFNRKRQPKQSKPLNPDIQTKQDLVDQWFCNAGNLKREQLHYERVRTGRIQPAIRIEEETMFYGS